jgi:CRP/FNR family transcriptional regulator, cyclic AMP receptor protein
MPERFAGPEGRVRLVGALRRQHLVGDSEDVAHRLAETATVRRFARGEVLIHQGAGTDAIFFLLSGGVSVTVNDQEVATRGPRDHVGEMAVVEPGALRSATVTAREDTIVVEVGEAAFAQIADDHPALWKRIATELSHRLRQRNTLVRVRNVPPQLFLGCTVEALPVAEALQVALQHAPFRVRPWTQGVFSASQYPLESLDAAVQASDVAAVVLSPDDRVESRGVEHMGPRDNVLFELGLFMGALGRGRTFLLKRRGTTLKIPSDLLGLTLIEYGTDDDLAVAVGAAATTLKGHVARLGAR